MTRTPTKSVIDLISMYESGSIFFRIHHAKNCGQIRRNKNYNYNIDAFSSKSKYLQIYPSKWPSMKKPTMPSSDNCTGERIVKGSFVRGTADRAPLGTISPCLEGHVAALPHFPLPSTTSLCAESTRHSCITNTACAHKTPNRRLQHPVQRLPCDHFQCLSKRRPRQARRRAPIAALPLLELSCQAWA